MPINQTANEVKNSFFLVLGSFRSFHPLDAPIVYLTATIAKNKLKIILSISNKVFVNKYMHLRYILLSQLYNSLQLLHNYAKQKEASKLRLLY